MSVVRMVIGFPRGAPVQRPARGSAERCQRERSLAACRRRRPCAGGRCNERLLMGPCRGRRVLLTARAISFGPTTYTASSFSSKLVLPDYLSVSTSASQIKVRAFFWRVIDLVYR